MTVKPGKGFSLHDWSSNLAGLVTSSATVRFVMGSNLVLTATLVDVQRPVNIIKGPAVNQHVASSSITVMGKASDNVGVTGVWYQMNSGQWLLGLTTDAWTNWNSGSLSLVPGANVVRAYAKDAAGNTSLTNSVKFTSTAK